MTDLDSKYTHTPTRITPTELIAALPVAFERGTTSGDLLFFESTVSTHAESGIDFELCQCPALLHKPTLPTPHFEGSQDAKKSTDPFAPPYLKGLLVGAMLGEDDEEYIVMLNKYSVVKHHFLLITKTFQSQNTPPTPPDLTLAYQILAAAQRKHQPFLAFFNCGDRSGASQPHKHLQFIPLDEDGEGAPFDVAVRNWKVENESTPFSLPTLPYAHFIRRLPHNLASASTPVDRIYDTLMDAFVSVLDLAVLAIRHDPDEHPRGPPSYNVLLTPTHLTIIPRSKGKHALSASSRSLSVPSSDQGQGHGAGVDMDMDVDPSPSRELSINSLGFAGMFLVKSDEEARAVRAEGLVNILRGVGVPKMADEGMAEPQSMEDAS